MSKRALAPLARTTDGVSRVETTMCANAGRDSKAETAKTVRTPMQVNPYSIKMGRFKNQTQPNVIINIYF